jgi:hypothetical protein
MPSTNFSRIGSAKYPRTLLFHKHEIGYASLLWHPGMLWLRRNNFHHFELQFPTLFALLEMISLKQLTFPPLKANNELEVFILGINRHLARRATNCWV